MISRKIRKSRKYLLILAEKKPLGEDSRRILAEFPQNRCISYICFYRQWESYLAPRTLYVANAIIMDTLLLGYHYIVA